MQITLLACAFVVNQFVETVTKLTNELVASYARVGGINHLDGKNLPSKRAIAAITQDLLRLLFPGFFDEKLIHSSEIKVETAALLDSIFGKLEDEIRKSLEYHPPERSAEKGHAKAAHALTVEFLGKLPRIREILHTDMDSGLQRRSRPRPAGRKSSSPIRSWKPLRSSGWRMNCI